MDFSKALTELKEGRAYGIKRKSWSGDDRHLIMKKGDILWGSGSQIFSISTIAIMEEDWQVLKKKEKCVNHLMIVSDFHENKEAHIEKAKKIIEGDDHLVQLGANIATVSPSNKIMSRVMIVNGSANIDLEVMLKGHVFSSMEADCINNLYLRYVMTRITSSRIMVGNLPDEDKEMEWVD